jgi:hypothetical protein
MPEVTVETYSDDHAGEAPVRGFLHRAAASSGDALVLTHGASGNCNGPLLVALAGAFAASGLSVLRCDLPFRQTRPQGPPSPGHAQEDQEGLLRAVTLLKEQLSGRVFLGGQSYGGRQASLLAASGLSLASGLLLLSYPLHPPGRPAQLRTAHFPKLETPALFVSGTKDAFGSVQELETAIKLIPAKTRFIPVPGAGHSLLTKANRQKLPETIVETFRMFVEES